MQAGSFLSNRSDRVGASWTSLDAIRLSLGLIYFHFGFLKFFPDLSPAEVIASYTAMKLTGFHLQASGALMWIAVMECAIGLGFLFKVWMRWVGILFGLHMAATFLPLFVLPEFSFKFVPFAPSIEGQYIMKNLVLLSAGWAVVSPYIKRGAEASAGKETEASKAV